MISPHFGFSSDGYLFGDGVKDVLIENVITFSSNEENYVTRTIMPYHAISDRYNKYLSGKPIIDNNLVVGSVNSVFNIFSPGYRGGGDDHDDHGDDDEDGHDDHSDDDSDEGENEVSSLIVQKYASADSISTGSIVTYTILIQNIQSNSGQNNDDHGDEDDHGDDDNNDSDSPSGVVTRIIDHLPVGFTYMAGSATGLTNIEPTISGSNLTWNGNWVIEPGQYITLSFDVSVGYTRGLYENTVFVADSNSDSISSGPTAPVQVIGPQLTLTKSINRYNAAPGDTLTYYVNYFNTGDDNATFVFILESIPENTTYVVGSAQGSSMNIMFSDDGGATYNSNQINTTDISFQRTLLLAPGEIDQVTFKVIVK